VEHRRPAQDRRSGDPTVTLIRSAIRGLLKVAEAPLEAELRAVLKSGEDYATSAKPQIDWDDPVARDERIDSRARDAYALLVLLEGRELGPVVTEAATLLATVVGQDIEEGDDGVFRIVRGVARDRIISTVDPDARHGRKTQAKGFDGYKGHAAIDPDSEIITETVVTPGNVGDAAVAEDLIADLLADEEQKPAGTDTSTEDGQRTEGDAAEHSDAQDDGDDRRTVYGDNAYGTGPFQQRLEDEGIESRCKAQSATAAGGLFTKDRFDVDVVADTVTCPNGVTVTIKHHRRGGGMAYFKDACRDCPLRDQCTASPKGRTIGISAHEEALARARVRQRDPAWRASWPTSCVGATAGDERAYAAERASTPTYAFGRRREPRSSGRRRGAINAARMGNKDRLRAREAPTRGRIDHSSASSPSDSYAHSTFSRRTSPLRGLPKAVHRGSAAPEPRLTPPT
jgi:hypothetical protein